MQEGEKSLVKVSLTLFCFDGYLGGNIRIFSVNYGPRHLSK